MLLTNITRKVVPEKKWIFNFQKFKRIQKSTAILKVIELLEEICSLN